MEAPTQIEPDEPWDEGWSAGWPAGWPAGWSVRAVDQIASTNTALVSAVDSAPEMSGPPHRAVLVARYQSAGRGRLDRSWQAPPGKNLLASILVREVPEHPIELTHRVGLAAIDACAEVAGVTAALKWPNDLLLGERKLAGILAQQTRDGSVVVGIGLNVGWAPPDAALLGVGIEPLEVLRALLVAYDRLPSDISERYRSALTTLGRSVRVEQPGGEVVGRAVDVEADGALVVIDACAITHRIDIGDVIHLRNTET